MSKIRKQKKDTDNEDKKIKNIESFISFIKEIKATGNIFYRGHSNETYNLEPSIYRKDKKTNDSEDGEVIVFDIPQESTCYFDSDKVTILANLAKCKNYFYYRDGDMPSYKKYIKELENKAKTISYNIEIGKYIGIKKDIIERIKDYIKEDKYFFIDCKDIDNQINKIIGKKNSDFCFENHTQLSSLFIEELERETKNLLWEERLSINDEYLGELLHFIKEDKSYFQNIINPDDIGSVFAIKPKLDNPRIVRQHGAFLIFGIEKVEISIDPKTKPIKKMIKVPSEWIIRGKVDIEENEFDNLGKDSSLKYDKEVESKERLIIDHKSKRDILAELDKLGINQSTLFPEIDKVANYIKEKYTTKN